MAAKVAFAKKFSYTKPKNRLKYYFGLLSSWNVKENFDLPLVRSILIKYPRNYVPEKEEKYC